MYVMQPFQYGLGAASGAQDIQAVGATLLSGAAFTGPAAPFVAGAGAVAELLGAIGIGAGCGQNCITASDYANKAQALLVQNLATYQALPSPRAKSAQTAAASIFNQVWQGLVQACGTVPGAAGSNCIGDRQPGGKFDWWAGYLNPILNDPNVVDDSVASTVSNAASASVSVGGASIPVWGLLAAAVALFFVVKGS